MRRVHAAAAVMMIAMVAVAAGCAEKRARVRPIKVGTVDTGPQSLEAARRQLEGTWELVSLSAGPQALKASGRMTYDAYGNMTVKGTIEAATITSPIVALLNYEGRAVIDAAKQQLRLVGQTAEGATVSAADMSADKLRQYAFDGDLLKISTIDPSGAVIATATWRRGQ